MRPAIFLLLGLPLACSSFGSTPVDTQDSGPNVDAGDAGVVDAVADVPAVDAGSCTSLLTESFDSKTGGHFNAGGYEGSGETTVLFATGALVAHVRTTAGSTSWRAYAMATVSLTQPTPVLRLRYNLKVKALGVFYSEIGCAVRMRAGSNEQEIRLEINTSGGLVLDAAQNGSGKSSEIFKLPFDDRVYPVVMDIVPNSDWSATDVVANVGDGLGTMSSVATGFSQAPTSVDLRCGVVFLNNGLTDGLDVTVDDVVFASCVQ